MASFKSVKEIGTVALSALKPIENLSVSEWADKYRIISQGAAEPGKWKTSRAPYQREPMNAFTDTKVKMVVLMCASQLGKSDCMLNVIGRFAQLDPCAVMLIQPSVDMAEDFSKSRIAPMIKDTKSISKLFNDDNSKTANSTILSKMFPGGRLIMCGANSPTGLASRPIRILLADEIDRFPESAGGEGNPVELAAKRTTTFWNAKIGLFSTPTQAGRTSGIEAKYLTGTQEEWQHECPNCREYHLLRWQNMDVDYSETVDDAKRIYYNVKSVRWRCPDCGFLFSRTEMAKAKQKYVMHNEVGLENGVRSFKVNCFASPWLKWEDVALEYLESKGDPAKEKVVVNTRFSESYQEHGAFEDDTEFLKRREDYGAELPEGVLLLTAAVDTQDNRLEYEICGWGMNEECWGIARGKIMGRPDNLTTYQLLDNVLDKEYKFANGLGMKITRTFIDSGGHYTGYIYDYCKKSYGKQRIPIKGRGGAGIPLNYKIAKDTKSPVPLVILGVDDGKQQIMNRLNIKTPGKYYFHFPLDEALGYDQTYFKGLISEQKKTVKRNGRITEAWEPVKINGKQYRNEPLDMRVYNLACMKSLNADWTKLYNQRHNIVALDKPKKKKKVKSSSWSGGIW